MQRTYYVISNEYQEALKALLEAVNMMETAVGVSLSLVDQGADPRKALETLRTHHAKLARILHGD